MRCFPQLRPAQPQALPLKPFISRKILIRSRIAAVHNNHHASRSKATETTPLFPTTSLARILGAAAAAVVLATAPPSFAELQTVPADQVTSMAKPLKVETVNKNRIWLLFVLGASSLFGVTILAENNEAWFPAISRANKAMKASAAAKKKREEESKKYNEVFEERLNEVRDEREEDYRLESAVAEGLAQARRPPSGQVIDVSSAAAALGAAAGAAVEETNTYPSELGIAEEAEDEEETASPTAASSSGSGSGGAEVEEEEEATSNGDGGDDLGPTRVPLFEIGADQIDASVKNYQRKVLDELSVEDLQRALEERKAAAGSQE